MYDLTSFWMIIPFPDYAGIGYIGLYTECVKKWTKVKPYNSGCDYSFAWNIENYKCGRASVNQ